MQPGDARRDEKSFGCRRDTRSCKSNEPFDEIDRALATPYGLTDEELDFINNYESGRCMQDVSDECSEQDSKKAAGMEN